MSRKYVARGSVKGSSETAGLSCNSTTRLFPKYAKSGLSGAAPVNFSAQPKETSCETVAMMRNSNSDDFAQTREIAVRRAANPELIKMGWGGKREGAGRPTKIIAASRLVGHRWYVVEAEPREIHTACRSIIDKGFDAFLPTVAVVAGKANNNKRIAVHRPMFYQFLFVRFDVDHDEWRAIRSNTDIPNGIKRLLTTASQRPVPVERGFVEHLQDTAAERLKLPPEAMPRLKAEQTALIKAGTMEGYVGQVVACDGVMTKMLITVFNRPCEVLVRRADVVVE